MGKLRIGYGSEWHLLRFLGRHRRYFSNLVLGVTGGHALEWVDFDFTGGTGSKQKFGDAELTALDFLPEGHTARRAWLDYWPQSGNAHNWDAVGVLDTSNGYEWVLVEAKANVEELQSACGAKSARSLKLIRQRLDETKQSMGIDAARDWTRPHYQYANRLAALHFLRSQGVAARLLLVYFCGDLNRGATCPKDRSEWQAPLGKMKDVLGLSGSSDLERYVQALFVPVAGSGS